MVDLPRNVVAKPSARHGQAYYFVVQKHWRDQGCPVASEPLGPKLAAAIAKAETLNGLIDEWNTSRKGNGLAEKRTPVGTVAWLLKEYRTSQAYLAKVSPRSRPDYERVMQALEDTATTDGRTVGALRIESISPLAADKIVGRIRARIAGGPKGSGNRRGDGGRTVEKVVAIAARAWAIVRRLHPEFFRTGADWNPWDGLVLPPRVKKVKPAVRREDVYRFAEGAVRLGRPEIAAAAVICFEWLQRPENVLAGYIRWSDYRPTAHPLQLRIEHHKTGAVIWQWLEDPEPDHKTGGRVLYYAEAEAILAAVPRRGVPIVTTPAGTLYTPNLMGNAVRTLRGRIEGVPPHFSLDACRHGGMTELEERGLTEGQGKGLSGHRTTRAYGGYAKDTAERTLEATRKRFGK